jgi:hypothetical protein
VTKTQTNEQKGRKNTVFLVHDISTVMDQSFLAHEYLEVLSSIVVINRKCPVGHRGFLEHSRHVDR